MKVLTYFISVLSLVLLFSTSSCNDTKQENNSNKEIGDTLINPLEDISEKIKNNPDKASLYTERAKIKYTNQDIEEAIIDLDISIKLDSTIADNYLLKSDYYLRQGKSGKSKETLEKCLLQYPENVDALLRLASIHLYVKQYEDAMDLLLIAQKADRYNPDIYYTKGLVYKELGETKRAIENFQATVDKEPEYYNAYILLGQLCAEIKDSLSIHYYKNAINLVPESTEAYYGLAMYYQEDNRYNEAFSAYDKIIEIDENNVNSYYNKGFIYMEYLKQYDNAIELFTKAIDVYPSYFQAYHNIGYCYEKKGNLSKAQENYKKALKILPNYQLSIEALNNIEK